MNLKKLALLLAASALLTASAFALNEPAPTIYTSVAPFYPAPTGTLGQLQTTGAYSGLYSAPGASPVFPGDHWTVTAPNSYTHSANVPLVVTVAPGTGATSGSCYYTTGDGLSDQAVPSATSGTPCADTISIPLLSGGATNVTNVWAVDVASSGLGNSTTTKYKITVEATLAPPTYSITTSTGANGVQLSVASDGVSGTGATIYPTVKYSLVNTPTVTAPGTAATLTSGVSKAISVAAGSVEQTLATNASGTGWVTSPTVSAFYGTGLGQGSTAVQYFIGSGSSAQQFVYALAFSGPIGDGANGACGGHHFTKSSGAAASDQRSGATLSDTGNLVIAWDNSNDQTDSNVWNGTSYVGTYTGVAPSKICVYLTTDSGLGVKAFMNANLSVPAEFLQITSSSGASNIISPFWINTSQNSSAVGDESKIPADVLAAVNGQPFNVGGTDIRPEDALFAATRALGTLNATRTGLGYGPGPVGTLISDITGKTFTVESFAISGTDPINKATQEPWTVVPLGAAPEVALVNQFAPIGDGAYHWSDPNYPPTNVGRFTLAGYFNGNVTGTTAIAPVSLNGSLTPAASGINDGPAHVWLREPLSGTYNTWEWSLQQIKEIQANPAIGSYAAGVGSEELGVIPAVAVSCVNGSSVATAPGSTSKFFTSFNSPSQSGVTCSGQTADGNGGNPLFITVNNASSVTTNQLGNYNASTGAMYGVQGATRGRAIGTGNMVKMTALVTLPSGSDSNLTTNSPAGSYACAIAETGAGTFSVVDNDSPLSGGLHQSDADCNPSTPITGRDSLGYTFWGYGNVGASNNNAAYTTRYLTVDGVDPLFGSYSGGQFPVCDATNYTTPSFNPDGSLASGGCPTQLTFPNVANGSYSIWSMLRAVTTPTLAAGTGSNTIVNTVLTQAIKNALITYDFLPISSMQVLHSHYLQSGVAANNGYTVASGSGPTAVCSYTPTTHTTAYVGEAGGDMGGAIYNVQENCNHLAEYGVEILSQHE